MAIPGPAKCPRVFSFVQQSRTENGPPRRFSLLASGQGLTAICEGGAAHFFDTIPATRSLDRETPSPEAAPRIYDLRFMSYDLKAEGRDVKTHRKSKPESSQPAWRTCLDFLLRTLPVSAVSVRAKQSQFGALPRGTGLAVQTKPICTGAIRNASPLRTNGYGESGMQRTSAKQSQFRAVPDGTRPLGREPGAPSLVAGPCRVQTNPIWGCGRLPICWDVGRGPCTNKANFHSSGRHELHVTLGDSLHRARGLAQTIAGVSSRIGM
jgi:hypothetical protein